MRADRSWRLRRSISDLRATEAKTNIALPLELRNDTVRIAVMANDSAGSVQLVDARFRRRPVGIVSGGAARQ